MVYSAVDGNGLFIGYVIFHEYDDDSLEIGWLLLRHEQKKGYATASLVARK